MTTENSLGQDRPKLTLVEVVQEQPWFSSTENNPNRGWSKLTLYRSAKKSPIEVDQKQPLSRSTENKPN